MNLTREHFRAMIFYDFKSSLTPKQCGDRLRNAFGEEAPSNATIYNWYSEFKRDRFFLGDEFREGRPRTAVTDENIAAVRAMLEEDRRISYEFIRATLSIGMSQIQNILHQQLDVRKLYCDGFHINGLPIKKNNVLNDAEKLWKNSKAALQNWFGISSLVMNLGFIVMILKRKVNRLHGPCEQNLSLQKPGF